MLKKRIGIVMLFFFLISACTPAPEKTWKPADISPRYSLTYTSTLANDVTVDGSTLKAGQNVEIYECSNERARITATGWVLRADLVAQVDWCNKDNFKRVTHE